MTGEGPCERGKVSRPSHATVRDGVWYRLARQWPDDMALGDGFVDGEVCEGDSLGGGTRFEGRDGRRQFVLVFAEGKHQHASAVPLVARDAGMKLYERGEAANAQGIEGGGGVVALVGQVMVPQKDVDAWRGVYQVAEEAVAGREHMSRLVGAAAEQVAADDDSCDIVQLRQLLNPSSRLLDAVEIMSPEVDVA